MVINEGAIDRVVRVGLGLLLVSLVFFGPKSGWLGIAGLVLLVTGLIGSCPLYRAFRIRTCRR